MGNAIIKPAVEEKLLYLEAVRGTVSGEIFCRYRGAEIREKTNINFFVQKSICGNPSGRNVVNMPVSKKSGEFSIQGLEPGEKYYIYGVVTDAVSPEPGTVLEFVTDITEAA